MGPSATSSSGVDTKLCQPDIEPQSPDRQEAGRAVAPRDLDLAPRSSRTHNAGAGQAGLVPELLALPSRLQDLSLTRDHAVPDAARIPEIALAPALDGFRALLSRSWSPETAYPDTVSPSHWIAGNPCGQCGVSSLWLAEILDREYSIHSTFCRGSLAFDTNEAEDVADHCWLEIEGSSGEELILDLTCDQARGFERQIVFGSRADLDREHVHYVPRERLDISDLPSNNPVWPRYQRLLLNMVMAMLATNDLDSR
jgi:hypothetical protein